MLGDIILCCEPSKSCSIERICIKLINHAPTFDPTYTLLVCWGRYVYNNKPKNYKSNPYSIAYSSCNAFFSAALNIYVLNFAIFHVYFFIRFKYKTTCTKLLIMLNVLTSLLNYNLFRHKKTKSHNRIHILLPARYNIELV